MKIGAELISLCVSLFCEDDIDRAVPIDTSAGIFVAYVPSLPLLHHSQKRPVVLHIFQSPYLNHSVGLHYCHAFRAVSLLFARHRETHTNISSTILFLTLHTANVITMRAMRSPITVIQRQLNLSRRISFPLTTRTLTQRQILLPSLLISCASSSGSVDAELLDQCRRLLAAHHNHERQVKNRDIRGATGASVVEVLLLQEIVDREHSLRESDSQAQKMRLARETMATIEAAFSQLYKSAYATHVVYKAAKAALTLAFLYWAFGRIARVSEEENGS